MHKLFDDLSSPQYFDSSCKYGFVFSLLSYLLLKIFLIYFSTIIIIISLLFQMFLAYFVLGRFEY